MFNLNKKKNLIAFGIISSLLLTAPASYVFAEENTKIEEILSMTEVGTDKVNNIDFYLKEKNVGVIEIHINNLDERNLIIDENKKGTEFIIQLKDASLSKDLIRKMIVKDFDTTVNEIDSYMKNNNTIIKIKTKEKSDMSARLQNNKLKLIIAKKNDIVDESVDITKIGEPVSVEFKDIDIKELFRVLAKYTDLNIITSSSVGGNITISFDEVPFSHALEVILQSRGLEKRIKNNIIYIAPANEITQLEEARLTSQNKKDELAPLESKFFQIKYAKANELEAIVKELGSTRSKIMVDERTNKIIVKDTAININNIGSIIDQLDIPITQVLIEARIVIAKTSVSKELGVKWGGTTFDGKNYGGSNYSDINDHFGSEEYKNEGSVLLSQTPMVDFGASSTAASIALGISSSTSLLDLELSALEKNGDAEVISRPKILTADKKTASIKSGTQIPYQETSGSSGATTTSFKDAVMLLEVTPQITPDGRIIMDLKVTQDSVGEITDGGPAIDTTQIETQVLVNNGETIVLGGIFKEEVIDDVKKVPLLGDLPLLGKLFRSKTKSHVKQELLIFITPKFIETDPFEALQ
jgi:type IV pilus assembly protein PilQ